MTRRSRRLCAKAHPWPEAANRWTDNVFMLKSWVEKKAAAANTHAFFKSQAGINLDTFDYLEE